MTAITFDTLKFVERLRAAGVPDGQAKAEAEALAEALSSGAQELATKGGLRELELRLDMKIETVKAELAIVKWMVSGIGFGVLLLVLKSFWPS